MWAPLISLRPDIQLTQNQTCTVIIFQMISDLSNFLVRTHEIFTFTVTHKAFFPAYFVFLLESVQMILTGIDIYSWFAVGFGDIERLGKSHFSLIDGMVMNAPISLIVQGFYCYRIWTLNKRWLWLCVVITIVRIFPSAVQPIPLLKR